MAELPVYSLGLVKSEQTAGSMRRASNPLTRNATGDVVRSNGSGTAKILCDTFVVEIVVRPASMVRRWTLFGLCGVWVVACWLTNHSQLALVVDAKTGAKYCVNRLAGYLGLPERSVLADSISTASVLIALALPFIIVGLVLAPMFMKWRARVLAAGLKGRYPWLFTRLKGLPFRNGGPN